MLSSYKERSISTLKEEKNDRYEGAIIVDSYNIAYYKITITKNKKLGTELIYTYTLDETIFDETTKYYIKIISMQIKKKNTTSYQSLTTISPTAKNIFTAIEKEIIEIIEHDLVISEKMKEKLKKIKTYIAFFVMGIESFYPLLIDHNIQEIYIDSEWTKPYLDHFKYGRCTVNHKFSLTELKRLVNLAILNGNLRLSEKMPSMKTELITDYFQIRITIDTPPITESSYALDIRRAKKKIITITELLTQNVLSLEALTLLYFLMRHKINIVIIGPPGSGKTTLANALDMLTPRYWRKIYIEDVIESLDLRKYGHHQFKLKVNNLTTTKYNEIIKILHRNPDWLYLGEILTREHSKALFHAILSGVVGIQTYHAGTSSMAISRWHNYHDIPYSIISNIGIIVSISKHFGKSGYIFRVNEISEVIPIQEEIIPKIQHLFVRNNLSDKLHFQKQHLSDVWLVKLVMENFGLTISEANQEFEKTRQSFELLVQNNITSIKTIIDFVNNLDNFHILGGDKL